MVYVVNQKATEKSVACRVISGGAGGTRSRTFSIIADLRPRCPGSRGLKLTKTVNSVSPCGHGSDPRYQQTSHGDDDFALSVSFLEVSDSFWYLAQVVRPVYDRCDRSGFK